ncbi:MAG: hypothetical protein H0U95_18295 [Bacteroidetes bacterium]|nr:hypothetical protein [Bacteroidota bacterium]
MSLNFFKLFFFSWLFFLNNYYGYACQCPLTTLGIEECNKYEIIFKGKVVSVTTCDNKFGTAVFEIEELYKGNASKQFTVLYECGVECAMEFNEGEEWVIYSNYKQVDKALMNWCSRSRKFFKNAKEDFYTTTYGNDYYDELKFLRQNLGLHRFLVLKPSTTENRNARPTTNQTILMLLISLTAIILFYWLFKKYFKF